MRLTVGGESAESRRRLSSVRFHTLIHRNSPDFLQVRLQCRQGSLRESLRVGVPTPGGLLLKFLDIFLVVLDHGGIDDHEAMPDTVSAQVHRRPDSADMFDRQTMTKRAPQISASFRGQSMANDWIWPFASTNV
jgi:hypothetical protein